MSYEHVVATANDGDLHSRIAACAATEGVEGDPLAWAVSRRWRFAAQPGWSDAYQSAIISFIDRPGWRPGAITDAMILSAVQAIITEDAAAV